MSNHQRASGFIWDQRFETGVPEIDSQHRELVRLLNRLVESSGARGESRVVRECLEEMIRYATYHFECEEAIMEAAGVADPHASAHVAEHRKFTAFVAEASASVSAGKMETGRLVEFGMRWLTLHILGTDMSLAAEMRRMKSIGSAGWKEVASETPETTSTVLLQSMGHLYGMLSERNALLAAKEEALEQANAQLEARVAERTRELSLALKSIEEANVHLKRNFMGGVRALSNAIELGGGEENRHAKRVAEHARGIAMAMGLPPAEIQAVTVAGLLHDLDHLGIDEKLAGRPLSELRPEERAKLKNQPIKAHAAISGVPGLDEAAAITQHYHEHWDGTGFPNGLKGVNIPLGSRILLVAAEYEHLRLGQTGGRIHSPAESLEYLHDRAGILYDTMVVREMLAIFAKQYNIFPEVVRVANIDELKPGMRLGRDVMSSRGVLLLAKDRALTSAQIQRLRDIALHEEKQPSVFVHQSGEAAMHKLQ